MRNPTSSRVSREIGPWAQSTVASGHVPRMGPDTEGSTARINRGGGLVYQCTTTANRPWSRCPTSPPRKMAR